MKLNEIKPYLNSTFKGIKADDLPAGTKLYNGKVRDVIDLGQDLILSVSDRISAFDVILGTIPFKGQILNQMALHWFKKTEDIIPNHIREKVSSRAVKVAKCKVLPVEVIIRGYLTGSAWRDYQAGKDVSGIKIPEGMKYNQKFPKALLTPSTKAEQGDHDEPISSEEIVSRGLVAPELWKQVEEAAFALFKRGTELAAQQGLILVDTKYEFGLLEGKLVVVDEIHTPDSSRFWYADEYQANFDVGKDQKKVDKEFLRKWLADQGFMGEGDAPQIPEDIRLEVAAKYMEAYKLVTGEEFIPDTDDSDTQLKKILSFIK